MTTDDYPKKRVMRGPLDGGCGSWAPVILPVDGVEKDKINATVLRFSRDGSSGFARASAAAKSEVAEEDYLHMRVGPSYERQSPWEERRLRSR